MANVLGYVRLQLYGIEAEARLFRALPSLKTVIISGSEDREECELEVPNIRKCKLKRSPLDHALGFLFRGNPSPIRMVTLNPLERYLREVDIACAVELYSLLTYDVCRIAHKRKIPVVTSVWETIENHPIHKLAPYAILTREVVNKTTMFVAYTKRAETYIRSRGVDQERIRVLYPGLDLGLFSPKPGRPDNEKIRILYVGRMDEEKGLRELLLAFTSICAGRGDVELWIRAKVRSGALASLLGYCQAKFPIKIVHAMSYDELPRLYNACDIFCMPSKDRNVFGIEVWEEQFGYCLMEAMACGLPIVSTKCGAIPEVIGEHNIFVPQSSVQSLTKALSELVDDRDKRTDIGNMNRRLAEQRFSLDRQARKLETVLKSLV